MTDELVELVRGVIRDGRLNRDQTSVISRAVLAAVTPLIEARAREEGFNAALAAVYHILHKCGEPCPQCHDAIAALDPAQIAGGVENE